MNFRRRLEATVLRRVLLLMGSTLMVLALVGCGDSEERWQLGAQPVDSDVMRDLLRLEDIEAVGGDISRLNVEVENVLAVAESVNPEQSHGVESWHAMKVKRGRSSAVLIFTVMELTSPDSARLRLSQVESGLGFRPMDAPVAQGSAKLSSSSGTGLTFVKGNRVVTLQTTIGEVSEPILDAEGVERLARMVAERL